jgi:hypothetical protein
VADPKNNHQRRQNLLLPDRLPTPLLNHKDLRHRKEAEVRRKRRRASQANNVGQENGVSRTVDILWKPRDMALRVTFNFYWGNSGFIPDPAILDPPSSSPTCLLSHTR